MLASLVTKPDLVMKTGSSGASGPWPLLQTLVVLGILFALLKWGAPRLVQRMNKRMSTPLNSPIVLQEGAACGASQLQVVEVRGRTLLLAVGTNGVTFLSDLTNGPATKPEPAFFDFVDRARSEYVSSDHEAVPEPRATVVTPIATPIASEAIVSMAMPKDEPAAPVAPESADDADVLSAYERFARLTDLK